MDINDAPGLKWHRNFREIPYTGAVRVNAEARPEYTGFRLNSRDDDVTAAQRSARISANLRYSNGPQSALDFENENACVHLLGDRLIFCAKLLC